MHSGVDKGWPFIGDKELVEGNAVGLLLGCDAVDTVNDFINAGVGRVHDLLSSALAGLQEAWRMKKAR